jgi:spore maturation protein CgeB
MNLVLNLAVQLLDDNMKILITYEDRVRPDSTGIYFREAFKKLGSVTHVYNDVLQYVKPGDFDVYIKIDDGLNTHKFPKELKPSVYYTIDTHIHAAWRAELAADAEFDYIFCAQKAGETLPWACKNVKFLPLGCDPNYHMIRGKRDKKYDVCFIGNVQPQWQKRRIERLDLLFKAFPNFYFGQKTFRDMAEKFAESKLVFNSQYSDDINMRVFEAMCSGSALITEKLDWQGMFEDGKHLIEYDSDENMIEQVQYYLENASEREFIAETGQREVLEKHTYYHRCKFILQEMKL